MGVSYNYHFVTMKWLFTIILYARCMIVAIAQTGQFFSTDNGLHSSLVNDILQDSRGYVWIATRNGLSRYDGHLFTTFQNTGKEGCLRTNYTYSLTLDRQNRLLIGTDEGVQMFDYATEQFTDVPLIDDSQTSNIYGIGTMLTLHNGDVVITTSGYGIFRLKAGQGRAYHEKNFPYGDLLRDVKENRYGAIWAVTVTGIICHYDGKQCRSYYSGSNRDKYVSLCIDRQGRIFAGTEEGGLYTYDEHQDSFRHIETTGNLNISTLLPLSEGSLLIGTNGNGAKLYHPNSNTIEPCGFYSKDVNLDQSKISKLMEDKEGNVWMGLFQKGVYIHPRKTTPFGYIGLKSGQRNVIGSSCVMSVFQDGKGINWVGTDGDGIYALDSNGKPLRHFMTQGSATNIMSMTEDDENHLWVGTFLNGVGHLDKNTGRFEQMPFTSKGYALHVFDVLIDRKSRLWVSTIGDGLKCYDPQMKELKEFRMPEKDWDDKKNVLSNNWVSDLELSRDGKRLYICMSTGLSCLDLEQNSFVNTFGKNHILTGVSIQKAFEDSNGTLWIGSAKGLYKVTIHPFTTKKYTTEDGLTDNSISAIEQDGNGRLWISTAYGISVMDIKNETFTNYYASNGLQGNEFSERASINTGDTLLAFGGSHGVSFINPQKFGIRQREQKVYLTDFRVNGERITKGMKSGLYEIVDTTVMDATHFDLAHNDNSLVISLSTMEYSNTEGIRYAYRLGEDDWTILPERTNEISLSHLPTGSYAFSIKAIRNGQESEIKQFEVVIHPAWYATIWAYIFYFFVAAYLIYRYLHHRKRKEQFRLRLQEHIHAEQLAEAQAKLANAQTQMIENISQEQSQVESPDEKLLRRIIDVINRNAANPDYNVDMIAKEVGLSRVHLYRKMKELTNQSPSEFISNIRLKLAGEMLSTQKQSIEDVAYACGFNSPNSFSRKFKSFYGKSPTEYMKEKLNSRP